MHQKCLITTWISILREKRNISLAFFPLWKNKYVSRAMFIISFSTSLGKCNFDLGFCEWANDLVSDNTSPWKLSSYRSSKRSVIKRPDHGGRLGKEIFSTLIFRFQHYKYRYVVRDHRFSCFDKWSSFCHWSGNGEFTFFSPPNE